MESNKVVKTEAFKALLATAKATPKAETIIWRDGTKEAK